MNTVEALFQIVFFLIVGLLVIVPPIWILVRVGKGLKKQDQIVAQLEIIAHETRKQSRENQPFQQ